MNWYIVHTRIEMLDALHIIGYAVWLASRYQTTVNIVNGGAYTRLTIDEDNQPLHPQAVALTRILRIPHADELSANLSSIDEFALHNLDGLLALLFTTPGVRVVSVDDLRTKIERDPAIVVSAMKKVTSRISRWKQYLEQNSITPDEIDTWYRQQQPVLLVDKPKTGLGLPMTIDPALSHSHRSPVSAGLISDKNGLSIKPSFIPILVYIGAARVLRAQRVANNLVNFYVHIPNQLSIAPDWSLPGLAGQSLPAHSAQILHWLSIVIASPSVYHYAGLSYQVLQTQGAQQSISVNRGVLHDDWLNRLRNRIGDGLLHKWRTMIRQRPAELVIEVDILVEALAGQRGDAWLNHLNQMAVAVHNKQMDPIYSIQQVREVAQYMHNNGVPPLNNVLSRETGTVRIGKSLRLLARFNPSIVRDLVEQLDSVRDRDQLIRIVAEIIQQCGIAKAKSEFITIPTDDDLPPLLQDIDRYGAKTVTNLIVILAALRYPSRDKQYTR